MPDTTVQAAAPNAVGFDLARYNVFTPPDPFEDHVGPIYFRIEGDQGLVGTVGATLDFLGSESTTALVERLHREDLPGTIRRAGAGACVVLAPGAGPTTIPLG